MTNINLKRLSSFMLTLGVSFLIAGCSEEAAAPVPAADFTTVRTGTSIAFTNTSTNATSYSWDFGDGSAASTDESPTHDYGTYGAYAVKLTATGAGGVDTKSEAIQVVEPIVIDGDFSDWAGIADAAVSNSDNVGAVTKLKITSDLTHVYIYVEGTSALGGFVAMYINSDGDSTTGWAPKENVFDANGSATATQAGGDFEIDLGGPWSDGSSSFEIWPWVEVAENLEQADWSFEGEETGGENKLVAPMKTGNAYEFAIVRGEFPGGLADVITVKFYDVDITDDDWIETGFLSNDFEGWIEVELFK